VAVLQFGTVCSFGRVKYNTTYHHQ